MKIDFEDGGYVEFSKSDTGSVIIKICAKDLLNSMKKIINSVEISKEEFKNLINSIITDNIII